MTSFSFSLRASATGLTRLSGGKRPELHEKQVYPAGAVSGGRDRAYLSRHTQWKTSGGRIL